MMNPLRKIFRKCASVLLGALSLILVVCILLQVAMIGLIGWLETTQGKDWLKTQLVTLAEQSGYNVTLSTVSLTLMDGLRLTGIRIDDADGPVVEADRIDLNVNLATLAAGRLTLSLGGGDVHILRLPVQKESSEPEELKPFSLPRSYLTSVSLNSLSIKRLHLDEGVAGSEIMISPELKSVLSWKDDEFKWNLDGKITQPGQSLAWMPEDINLLLEGDTRQLMISVKEAALKSASYQVSLQGQVQVGTQESLDLAASVHSDDLFPLTGQRGRASSDIKITGITTAPHVDANGKILLSDLQARGLDEIAFSLISENVKEPSRGQVKIETSYLKNPVTLAATYLYQDMILSLQDIKGTAPELLLGGSLSCDLNSLLMTGDLTASLNDASYYKDLLGEEIKGRAKVDLALTPDTTKQAASFTAQIDNAFYQEMSVQALTARAKIPDVRLYWPSMLDVQAKNLILDQGLSFPQISAQVKDQTGGTYALSVDAQGIAIQPFRIVGGASVSGIETETPSADDVKLSLTSKGSTLDLTGKASLDAIDLTASTKALSLGSLPVVVPEALQDASISGTARLTGSAASPVGEVDLVMSPLAIKKSAPQVTFALTGGYRDQKIALSMTGKGQGIKTLSGNVSLPANVALSPFQFDLSSTTPLTGDFNASLEANSVSAAFLPADQSLSGSITGQGTLSGTISAPVVAGALNFKDGVYAYQPYGVKLSSIMARLSLSGSVVTLESLKATDGSSGALTGQGSVNLRDATQTQINLAMRDFHLLNSKIATAVLSSDMQLKGNGDRALLSGTIRPSQVDVIIPEQFKSDIPQLNIIRKTTENAAPDILNLIDLNVQIQAENQIFVRGWGLDAEFGGDVTATGTLNDPQLNGNFKSIRGRYEEFGKRFTLARANLRFQGSVPPSPYLDIEATTTAGDVTASVLLTGAVAKPKISFTSTPALPQDEVLSRILFGKNMSKITPFQAIQLAQTLQRFSGNGGGGFDPLSGLRTATGLDDISVETDESGDTSVGVGKYLTDKVYLQVKKGKAETSGAASIQVEVTPSIRVESEVGQDAQAGGGVFWKWDY